MRLVHHDDGEDRVLAEDVQRAEGMLEQTRGVMFRQSLPEGYALAFDFDEPATRTIHTLFVFVPIDVLWLVEDEVVRVDRLQPFRGLAHGLADTVVELPAGAAEGVEAGDTVELVE